MYQLDSCSSSERCHTTSPTGLTKTRIHWTKLLLIFSLLPRNILFLCSSLLQLLVRKFHFNDNWDLNLNQEFLIIFYTKIFIYGGRFNISFNMNQVSKVFLLKYTDANSLSLLYIHVFPCININIFVLILLKCKFFKRFIVQISGHFKP